MGCSASRSPADVSKLQSENVVNEHESDVVKRGESDLENADAESVDESVKISANVGGDLAARSSPSERSTQITCVSPDARSISDGVENSSSREEQPRETCASSDVTGSNLVDQLLFDIMTSQSTGSVASPAVENNLAEEPSTVDDEV